MRSQPVVSFIAVSLIAAIGLSTGCKHPPKKAAPPQGGDVPSIGMDGGTGIGVGDRAGAEGGNWQRGQFEAVYFAFDSAKVGPSELSKLQAVATKLKGGSSKLVIEGYTDERGTPEYNRSLGERRALACREELVRLGIAASSISTISYGEEKPADPGPDEAAWAKNRRCEFVVVAQ